MTYKKIIAIRSLKDVWPNALTDPSQASQPPEQGFPILFRNHSGQNEKPLMVFLHGFRSGPETLLTPAEECFALGYDYLILPLPGHGILNPDYQEGDSIEEKYSSEMLPTTSEEWAAFAQKTAVQLQTLGRDLILFGHSTGGTICIQMARNLGETVKKLILVSPFLDASKRSDRRKLTLLSKLPSTLGEFIKEGNFPLVRAEADRTTQEVPEHTSPAQIKHVAALVDYGKETRELGSDLSPQTQVYGFYVENDDRVDNTAIASFFDQLPITSKKLTCLEGDHPHAFLSPNIVDDSFTRFDSISFMTFQCGLE
jgi:alpha-beta hydrolase superfamily lysophospholipase